MYVAPRYVRESLGSVITNGPPVKPGPMPADVTQMLLRWNEGDQGAIGHFRRALSLLERLAEKLLEEGLNGSQAARGQDTQNQKGALHRTLLGIG